MKKRKLKRGPIVFIIIIITLLILGFVGVKLYKHYTSIEYKLGKIGYNADEITTLVKMDTKVTSKALEKYDEHLISLTKQKYFMWKNYDIYKEYINKKYQETNTIDYNEIITKVNVNRNYNFYTHTKETDMNKEYAILVNKYHNLPDKYAPNDIVDVSNQHGYGNNKIRKEVYEAFKEMFEEAKKENITLIINSGYRDYNSQTELYNKYKNTKGEEYADGVAARPNFSEHQTGLALDLITYGASGTTFESTTAFTWLMKNADKYGFILRYPKDKEEITGYSYESWHWRYVGKSLAPKVKNSNLTYEEYYAYYIDGDSSE